MQTQRQGNSTTCTYKEYNKEISALKNVRYFSELSESMMNFGEKKPPKYSNNKEKINKENNIYVFKNKATWANKRRRLRFLGLLPDFFAGSWWPVLLKTSYHKLGVLSTLLDLHLSLYIDIVLIQGKFSCCVHLMLVFCQRMKFAI